LTNLLRLRPAGPISTWSRGNGIEREPSPFGPGGGTSTSQGHPYSIFRRAIERKNLLIAEATAKELPPLNLTDALELTLLIARKEPRRHPRVATRWLLRYLEECNDATIEEAAMVAACLAALAGDRVGFVNSVVADFQGNPEPAVFGR
jgi:hypothetical protein